MPPDQPRLPPPDGESWRAHRSTKATVKERVTQCVDLLLSGAGFRDLVVNADKNRWGVSRSAIRRYEKLAYQWIEQNNEDDRQRCYDLAMNQRRRLFFSAMKRQDIHLAHQILMDMDKLRGTYVYQGKIAEKEAELWTPPRTEHDAEISAILDKAREAVARLRARAAAEAAEAASMPKEPPT